MDIRTLAKCTYIDCGKRCFEGKQSALRFARSLRFGRRMRAYFCDGCRAWHVATKDHEPIEAARKRKRG